jgi:subtilisin family serine protease
MTRIERGRFLACVLVAAILIAGGTCAAGGSNLQKIVVFVDGTPWQVQQQVIARSGSQVRNVLPLINGVAIQLPAPGTAQALSTLQADPTVEGVYDDPTIAAQGAVPISADGIVIYIQPAPAPSQETYGWGLAQIGIPDVHAAQPGLDGSGVKVALLDTGIDVNHPDLKQNIIGGVNARAGADLSNYQDDNGHGTHIAGIIAGRLNKQGVIGAAPHILIYAIKVLDYNGAGQVSDLISGLGWVRANNINLINMSLGFPHEWGCPADNPTCPHPYPVLEKAIKRLYDAGVIMVVSAGNRNPRRLPAQGAGGDGAGGDTAPGCNTAQGAGGDGAGGDAACSCSSLPPDEQKTQNTAQGAGGDGAGGDGSVSCYQTTAIKVPAFYPWVIAVGATDAYGKVTDYSRSGPAMTDHGVVAPGGAQYGAWLLSTAKGGGYGLGIGTSQAAAHVTGTIALALQLRRDLSFNDVLALLRGTSKDILPFSYSPPTLEWEGSGLIDAQHLLDAVKKLPK